MSTLVSNAKLAVHLGCLPPVVTKYEALGVIEKTSAGKFDQDLCRLKVLSYLRELAAGRSGKKHTNQGGPDLATERAKLAQQQTEAIKLKNAIAVGQFVPVAIVVEVVELRDSLVREKILSIPTVADQIASLVNPTTAQIEEILRSRCYEALEELSDPRTFDLRSDAAGDGEVQGGAVASPEAEGDDVQAAPRVKPDRVDRPKSKHRGRPKRKPR